MSSQPDPRLALLCPAFKSNVVQYVCWTHEFLLVCQRKGSPWRLDLFYVMFFFFFFHLCFYCILKMSIPGMKIVAWWWQKYKKALCKLTRSVIKQLTVNIHRFLQSAAKPMAAKCKRDLVRALKTQQSSLRLQSGMAFNVWYCNNRDTLDSSRTA